MSEIIFPPHLQNGDHVRVIAPSGSLAVMGSESRSYANTQLAELGLEVSYAEHAEEQDIDGSSSIENRIADIHDAFTDPSVDGIFTAIGGYYTNQLLSHIDWGLIRANPKVFCGFSDITALQNAMLAQAGLVTYSGPHYSTLGQKHLDPYTTDYLKRSLFDNEPYVIRPSDSWSDDLWFLDQDKRQQLPGEGHWVLQSGQTKGTAIGGNLGTFQLLQGTDYVPNIPRPILFAEETAAVNAGFFDRNLQAFLQSEVGRSIGGLVIGRFQQKSSVTREQLARCVARKPELTNIPVVANVDFGHTDPRATFPIGGLVELEARNADTTRLTVVTH